MKPTLLLGLGMMVFGMPERSGASELEALRARCVDQDRQIRLLEDQIRVLQKGSDVQVTSSSSSTYTVRNGDSLEKIARRAGTTPAAVAKLNGLRMDAVIHPGQKLKMPGSQSLAKTQPTPVRSANAVSAPRSTSSATTHTVRPGDTFSAISRQYGVSIDQLTAANPGVKPTAIRPGQKISLSAPQRSAPAASIAAAPEPKRSSQDVMATLPAPTTQTISTIPPAAAAPATVPAPAVEAPSAPAAPAEQPLSPTPAKSIHSVTIEEETTFGEFAAKHGTDTARLNDLNGLDLSKATVLARGSELYVPAQP